MLLLDGQWLWNALCRMQKFGETRVCKPGARASWLGGGSRLSIRTNALAVSYRRIINYCYRLYKHMKNRIIIVILIVLIRTMQSYMRIYVYIYIRLVQRCKKPGILGSGIPAQLTSRGRFLRSRGKFLRSRGKFLRSGNITLLIRRQHITFLSP